MSAPNVFNHSHFIRIACLVSLMIPASRQRRIAPVAPCPLPHRTRSRRRSLQWTGWSWRRSEVMNSRWALAAPCAFARVDADSGTRPESGEARRLARYQGVCAYPRWGSDRVQRSSPVSEASGYRCATAELVLRVAPRRRGALAVGDIIHLDDTRDIQHIRILVTDCIMLNTHRC